MNTYRLTRPLSWLCLAALPTTAIGQEPLRIVTDLPAVASIASSVLGAETQVTVLLQPGGDPHGLSLKPSQARALSQADGFLWLGSEMSPGLKQASALLPDTAVTMTLLDLPASFIIEFEDEHGHDDHGDEHHDDEHGEKHGDEHGEEHAEEHSDHDDEHHDEKHADHDDHDDKDHGEEHAEHEDHDDHGDHDDHAGHDHGNLDPHAWLDTVNAKIWADEIAEHFGEIRPGSLETFEANAAAFSAEMTALEAEISERLSARGAGSYWVYHDGLGYFQARFDIPSAEMIEEGDGRQPSAADLKRLGEVYTEMPPACVVTRAGLDHRALSALPEMPKTVDIDMFGTAEVGGFASLMTGIADALVECFEG
ncbi:MAG: zinc ABC transporter substrate-binding protein [Pseudomonadota bacterium]